MNNIGEVCLDLKSLGGVKMIYIKLTKIVVLHSNV